MACTFISKPLTFIFFYTVYLSIYVFLVRDVAYVVLIFNQTKHTGETRNFLEEKIPHETCHS